ncbi:MAG: hypothetical protein EAZ80_06760 [Runella slithyformis]|nr:MAG: hypothetical protein EAZ80_06760 [Runella slithyformis]
MIDRVDIVNTPNGGYMRTISVAPTNQQMSRASLAAAQVAYVIEAYDSQQGRLLDRYDLQARFVDNTPANGTNSVPYRAFVSIPASTFAPFPASGLPRTTMTIRAADLIRVLGLNEANISPTDRFEIDATLFLTTGSSFNLRNTGANITGGAFYNSPFFYRITVAP